jgi:hypothetical protein
MMKESCYTKISEYTIELGPGFPWVEYKEQMCYNQPGLIHRAKPAGSHAVITTVEESGFFLSGISHMENI